MTEATRPPEHPDDDERDERMHADRSDAAASPLNPDRGDSRLPEGPEEAAGNWGWNEPSAEAAESLEGAVRRADDPQNGEPIWPGSVDNG